jgi:EAL domain-containing protein (putative c-di-GMP-specific phosphodiesterase class I)/DNA-binding NarL/FixJ family response regulator
VIRVLLAEDDALVRQALAKLIDGDPSLTLVACAADATDAVALAAREQPDVAVLDVRMPRGGGVAAARGISRRSPETRILALSAQDDRATVLEMLEAGAVGYLVKGSSVDSIVRSIALASDGRGSLSAEVTGEVIEELAGQLSERRRAADRVRLREARIRRALSEDGVLSIAYQPITTLLGEIVGAEALARFIPLNRGPAHWFAEAAEVGLRAELELEAARKALRGLTSLPPLVYLSLNVSPPTVAAPGLRKLLEGADASRVVIEVTEDAKIDDYERFGRALARLRDRGVRVAVDDAGAGFASLRHILRLAPDFIKLDRTLVSGIERDRAMQALAAGLISFADKIGAAIIAEGIERADELAALASLGVPFGQGYYLGKPGPLPLRVPGPRRRRAIV